MNEVIIISILLGAAGAQKLLGDSCSMKDGTPGICTELLQCNVVYQYLLAGKPPDTQCGWAGSPIVCCPLFLQETPASESTTTSEPEMTLPVSRRPMLPGVLARIKCTDYARSVYALVEPPTLIGDRKPVNVSLCAIKSQKLIFGGTKAEPKEFPHMAAVGFGAGSQIIWSCGGTLISDLYVLTAAHCTYSVNAGSAEWIRVGDLNLETDDDDAKPQQRRITGRYRHPNYKAPLQYHDIALLRMEYPVNFDAWVRPACLPTADLTESAQKAIATGWGSVDDMNDVGSKDLLKVTLPIVPRDTCNRLVIGNSIDSKFNEGIVDAWQLCAGEEGKDTCQGDSGGPLAIYDSSNECMYDVIGVTSVGPPCGSAVPAVYTRVSHYLSWLENEVWK